MARPTVPLQALPASAGQATSSAAAPSAPSASVEPEPEPEALAVVGRAPRTPLPSIALITVVGGVVSMRNVQMAGDASALPALSVARASKRCSPSASAALR